MRYNETAKTNDIMNNKGKPAEKKRYRERERQIVLRITII